jgi:hypothetical protein
MLHQAIRGREAKAHRFMADYQVFILLEEKYMRDSGYPATRSTGEHRNSRSKRELKDDLTAGFVLTWKS